MQNLWLYSAKWSHLKRQTRLQDISDRKAICSQLETLEKRVLNLANLVNRYINAKLSTR